MSLRDELAGVLARDSRYTFQAYEFVFHALELAKTRKARARSRARRARRGEGTLHVNGRELCEAARELAQSQYGLLALAVLAQWGLRSTGDIGDVVFNLIAAGDFEKTPTDRRADFDDVFDFDTAFRRDYVVALDDVA